MATNLIPRMSSSINTVFFDFGGTLFDISDEHIQIWKLVSDSMSEPDWNEQQFRSGLALARDWLDAETASRVAEGAEPEIKQSQWDEYYRIILKTLGIKRAINYLQISELRSRLMDTHPRYSVKLGVPEVLQALKRKFHIGLISNTTSDVRPYLKDCGILSQFDVIVLSYEANRWKPDQELFQIACSNMGIDVSEAAYIGDSLVCDAIAAQEAGLEPILLDELNRHDWSGRKVTSVLELPSLFGLQRLDYAHISGRGN